MEPGKVVLQDEKVIVERHEMTYVLVKKCCEFNLKNVGGERVTTFDAEAAKTKAPIKKVNNDVDDDCKETASRDESLAVSKQEETLPEESNNPYVVNNRSSEAEETKVSELDETTVAINDWARDKELFSAEKMTMERVTLL